MESTQTQILEKRTRDTNKIVESIELKPQLSKHPGKLVWSNIFLFGLLHIFSVYALILLILEAKWYTWLWVTFLYFIGIQGIAAGAHRLWSHKSYKAKLPLRVLLAAMNAIAFQDNIIDWSLEHRGHHKWSDTDADPYNASRGFFFSHVGWLLVEKHPEVIRKAKTIDMSDLYSDPVLVFQKKYYPVLMLVLCFILPTVVPVYGWDESALIAFGTAGLLRYCLTLHATWSVNSIAHIYGYKPYDKTIKPTQNIASTLMTFGEGFHNYHHSFPTDYRTSEYPWLGNFTTMFIDFFALIGWAYDRKAATPELIRAKKARNKEI